MPPLPRLRIGPLADIAAAAPRLSPASALAGLERAETLAQRIDPNDLYPLARVIADLRPDSASSAPDDGSSVVGAALLADLAALAEHLAAAAKLDPAQHAAPAWLDAASVCKRWGVSRSTLDRYRKRGLLGRRLETTPGRTRLVFAADRVEAFAAVHRPALERAGSFTRITPVEEARIRRRADRYRRVLGWSTSRTAQRIAEHFGRSPEAVRLLLVKTDDGVSRRAPVRARERAIIARAAAWGVEVDRLAERFGRSEGSIYRALVQAHAERLARLRPEPPAWDEDAGRFNALDAASTFLDHAPVQTGLGRPAPTSLAELLTLVEAAEPLTPAVERALARAYWFLRHAAGVAINALPRHNPPRSAQRAAGQPASGVDDIETMLRWAARVKAELVRSQLPLVVRSVEAAAERPVSALAPAQVGAVYSLAIGTVAEAVERHDPFKSGRLAAQAGLALNRSIAAWWRSTHAPADRPGAARARPTPPERVTLDDFTLALCPWQRELDLPAGMRRVLGEAPEPARTLIAQRMGWQVPLADGAVIGGGPPRSLAQIADALATPVWRVVRLEGQAVRALRARARGTA
jgi:transposase